MGRCPVDRAEGVGKPRMTFSMHDPPWAPARPATTDRPIYYAAAAPDRRPSDALTPCLGALDRTFFLKKAPETIAGSGAGINGLLRRPFGDYDESTGLDLRGTLIINPEEKLLNMEMNFYNLGRNIDEMMRKFKANIYMSKKTNEVCPSKWKDEGDKTLVDPGAKMVGKVHEALNP